MPPLPLSYITVTDVSRLAPHMIRVSFIGDGLTTLGSTEPDRQVKLYFPRAGQDRPTLPDPNTDFMSWYQAHGALPEERRPVARSYTIAAHHPAGSSVDIDFVLHPDAGPATRWAAGAKQGDVLAMFGPSADFARRVPLSTSTKAADWVLIVGDDTALPAIASILAALPEGTPARVYAEVGAPEDELPLGLAETTTVHWIHRDGAAPGNGPLVDIVRAAKFPRGAPFAWIAGEAGQVRALRRHLVDERGVDRRSIDFTGHWRLDLSQDDAPTTEDLAEARERLADA